MHRFITLAEGTPISLLDSNDLTLFRRRLFAWYRRHARDLPWRKTRDPYPIWVSEIMLQQTQVETVKPYYARFLKRFPTVADLAAADEQQVLHLWEGLGYYRRARQLHAAARVVVEKHGGRFPTDPLAVRDLPGIGRYTAAAILSIADDQRLPILEANTIRLFARLLALQQDPTQAAARQLLWEAAEHVLPRKRCGEFNQALMELGSRVCTTQMPQCDDCPVAPWCEARRQGIAETLPVRRQRLKFEKVDEVAVVIPRRGRVLLRQCQDGERWAGLWDFPRFAVSRKPGPHSQADIEDRVAEVTGLRVALGERLTTIKHGVTRFRITLHCYQATPISSRQTLSGNGILKWVSRSKLADFPLSTTGRKISRIVNPGTDD